uniref:Uncharacterized protein n=1 Tax=Triticum urartu TaxID=4572 RepID=A0A8R7QSG8_TRIUA
MISLDNTIWILLETGNNFQATCDKVSLNALSQSFIQKEGLTHGISCLSQDSYGAYITASCMDQRIYLYSTP